MADAGDNDRAQVLHGHCLTSSKMGKIAVENNANVNPGPNLHCGWLHSLKASHARAGEIRQENE